MSASQPNSKIVTSTIGMTQILAWGSSFYLPAVLAQPIANDTGWTLSWVVGGLSLGLLAAGLAAPFVGRTIERIGGRFVLASSSLLLAAGLTTLSLSQSLPVYLVAWAMMGVGMGSGLYDAAFSTLGRLYGGQARSAITTVTLFGGFASTICWPLSATLVDHFGWRGACGVYAAIHLFVAFPLHLLVVPNVPNRARALPPSGDVAIERPTTDLAGSRRTRALVLLATILTLGSVTASMIGVHLLTILQARGYALGSAVALGALIGPAQVGARMVEMAFGRRYHPIWTMATSTFLVAVGMALLLGGLPVVALALCLYGAGNGIGSIAKGTLPLALFGSNGYASLMGKLAMPALLAQALSPSLGAVLIAWGGAGAALACLTSLGVLNVALVGVLWRTKRTRP